MSLFLCLPVSLSLYLSVCLSKKICSISFVILIFLFVFLFQVFYDDCAFPLAFAYYMFGHAFIFFLLFAHFYIKAYLTPKTKLKVRMC